MKKLTIVTILLLLCASAYSQISYGRFVMFPDSKLVGSMWKPQINFTRINEQDVIGIRTVANNTYHSFDSDSRLLIRFADSTMVKLPILEEFEVQKNYENTWVGSTLVDEYITFSFYGIEDEIVNKIVTEQIPIVKIRIVFTNGSVADYDIKPNYQKKLIDGLVLSRNLAINENKTRKSNTADEDF